MTDRDEHAGEPTLRKLFLGSGVRAEREEKVLQYIIHRVNESAPLHEVVQEDYVRRNCTQAEIDEIVKAPELVHACRERLWQTFRSGELAPIGQHHAPSGGRSPDGRDALPPGA